MTRSSVELVFRALNDSGTRYLVAGGLAVVAHGYLRFTADIDIILDLNDAAGLRKALGALSQLDYRPRAPVALEDFADAAKRGSWIKEKGMMVFSLYSPTHPATEIDIFVQLPFPFDAAYEEALIQAANDGVSARFVDLDRLLEMKRRAGRERDRADIEKLEQLRENIGGQ